MRRRVLRNFANLSQSKYLTPQNSTSEQSLDSAWLLSTESVTRKASFKRASAFAGSILVYPCDACHSTKARIFGCSPAASNCAEFSRRSPNFCGGVSFGLAVFRCNCSLGPIGAGFFAGISCAVSAVAATRAATVTCDKKRELQASCILLRLQACLVKPPGISAAVRIEPRLRRDRLLASRLLRNRNAFAIDFFQDRITATPEQCVAYFVS